MEQKKEKVGFLQSIGFKICGLVLVSAFVVLFVCALLYTRVMKTTAEQLVKNNMSDLTTSNAILLNGELEKGSMSYAQYNEILSEVKIAGMESSYAYLVDESGIMQYHPKEEKVGNAVENDVVKGLVSELASGKTPAPAVVTYLYKGADKLAAYEVLSDRSILVITADLDDAYSFQQDITRITIYLVIGAAIVLVLAGYFFSMWITSPLKKVIELVDQSADFNFKTSGEDGKTLVKRKDEIGMTAKALSRMRHNLRDMVANLNASCETLDSCMKGVADSSVVIDEMCADTSATTEELAAGMEETSAASETIKSSISEMQTEASDINNLTSDGENLSNTIKGRADELHNTTQTATDRTTSLYQDMKEKTEKAIADAEAVSKINELTGAIMAISSQTSLLALNANIEAARAGEAGHGFAVVATEIGNLANQTKDTVESINEIVAEVNEVVSRMASTLTESINFLEDVVIKDYEQFGQVSEQYRVDAETFEQSMINIENSVTNLTNSISTVAESLSGITNTVTESTVGVTDIAEKASDINAKTGDNKAAVDECIESIGVLRGIAQQFQL